MDNVSVRKNGITKIWIVFQTVHAEKGEMGLLQNHYRFSFWNRIQSVANL